MINEKQRVFSAFMDEFVKLNIEQKSGEIVEKQKILLAYLYKFVAEKGIEYEFLKSREVNDIKTNNVKIDDYLDSIMVYTQNIEELIGLILNKIEQ